MKFLKSAVLSDQLHIINIETNFIRALPSIEIVGLASATIKEAATRVKSAISSLHDSQTLKDLSVLPPLKIIINLSPSDVKKDGSHFDLPIALLILMQKIDFNSDFFVFGELGLDGKVKSSAELFSILLFLSTKVKKAKVLVPQDIALKVAMIPNFEVFGIQTLAQAYHFFTDDNFMSECKVNATHPLFANTIDILGQHFVKNANYSLDFKDIKGQQRAKRACMISACGFHNILFEGSPGCGKSMSAKRLRYILPPQSLDEILLASAYQSLNSNNSDFDSLRSFRSPHHTSTRSSIFGGGSSSAKIGEIALANGGILFFDELPHFGKQILESLREPLEDNKINISRVNSKVSYDTKFIFVGAMNPCPCGNAFSKNALCSCSAGQIQKYKSVISQALLDRIDLYVAMSEVGSEDKSDISSFEMHEKIMQGFKNQILRGQKELNGKLHEEDISKYCTISNEAKSALDLAVNSYNLSQRGINKTLKVARTIADLDNKEVVEKSHILESLSFRVRQ